MSRLASLVMIAASSACSDDAVDPITRINEPRVLAITSEPSALVLDGAVAMSALTVDGDGPRASISSIRWRACVPWKLVSDPGRDCSGDDAVEVPTASDGTAFLEAARLEAAFVARAGADRPPPSLQAALAIGGSLRIPIIAEVDVDGQTLVARRDLEVVEGGIRRTNPRIVAIELDGAPAIDLRRGQTYNVTVHVEVASLDDSPTLAGAAEGVRASLYSTDGELGDVYVDQDGGNVAPGALALPATTYVAGDPGMSWLFVVVTDETAGLSVASIPLAIE